MSGVPTTPGPPPARAPGSQSERTALAWVRTALACAGLAAIAVRLADHRADLALVLAVGALVAAPGLAATWWRVRDLAPGGTPPGPRPWAVGALAGTIALVDLAVLARLVL